MSRLKTLLVLARASNLPTVWSNCFAGWLLGGGEHWFSFLFLCLGASLLYTGGMFLNDAFDASFDREFRKERPIPLGAIMRQEVWFLGITWLILGATFLLPLGRETCLYSVALIGFIVLYDWIHKRTVLSPILMGICRVLLYLAAASTGRHGVDGIVMWKAVALGSYVIGLSFLAKAESEPGPLRYWPVLLLLFPGMVAAIVNDGPWARPAVIYIALLGIWIAWSVRRIWLKDRQPADVGAAVSDLLAGIVLVDLLAVGPHWPEAGLAFGALFLTAKVFQRSVPAT